MLSRKILLVIVSVVLSGLVVIVISVVMLGFGYGIKARRAPVIRGIGTYRLYEGNRSGVAFKFEYPGNWRLEEEAMENRNGYWISFLGPVNKAETRRAGLDMFITPSSENDERFATLEKYVDYSIQQESIGETEVVFNKDTSFRGYEAKEIQISYTMLLPIMSENPQETLIHQRWIIINKDGLFFDLYYSAAEGDFEQYLEVYEHALETLEFMN